MQEKIHFFHTNDLHSHFEFWLRTQNYIHAQRTLLAEQGEPSFLIDIGDHIDRSNIYTEAMKGKGNVQLLNEAKYDVVTIGNNEGITFAHEDLKALYNDAQFEVIVANLHTLEGKQPTWLRPYTILTTKYGTKIGVVGATAQFEAFYRVLNWQVTEPRIAIIQVVEQLKEQVDIIVCLSHLGKTEDELLAEECPEIDVIFGSHTHHLFETGKLIGDVLLTGCGKFGQYLGHLTIEFDHQTKKIAKQEKVIECALLPSPKEEPAFLQSLVNEAQQKLDKPSFTVPKTYHKEWFHYSQLSHLFAEAIINYTDADCALFNAGIFLEDLQRGYVSAYDLHRILPHPINLCTIELTGTELKEIYMQSMNEEWPQLQFKGLGFRGIVFGKLLTYHFNLNAQRELIINGEIADLQRTYKLVTLDLFTFGYFFPSFKYAKKHYDLPLFLRDILKLYGQNKFK
ncbi:bifunctional metallophosphatase/5'-nucleotidase [Bacillus ndiopicus]|uniref:bifunctional metallophosphatase/5'-nucleotidase n=1 Tax=Bacillus ndiopicus TaxID=1347368 RepID=UPI0005A7F8B9|nr:bifunctional UDP-sugar hydrolase/5'-nucleotidase [Bacillus ndiopicus]